MQRRMDATFSLPYPTLPSCAFAFNFSTCAGICTKICSSVLNNNKGVRYNVVYLASGEA